MEKKRGKPVTHPKVCDLNTQKVYKTYTEAAYDIGGTRFGVMRCCEGLQRHHKGHVLIYYVETEHEEVK